MMLRRTFLKLTGAMAIVLTTPLFAKKEKPEWIRISDEFPKVGQEIVVKGKFSFNRDTTELWFGKVDEIDKESMCVATYENREIIRNTTVRKRIGPCYVYFPTIDDDLQICWRPKNE
jgi:hypothetical protein